MMAQNPTDFGRYYSFACLVFLSSILLATSITDSHAAACEVNLKSPVPLCAGAPHSAAECEELAPGVRTGKAGDRVYPTIIRVMSSGAVFAGAPHENAIELKYLTFKGCKFRFRDRDENDSPEFVSYFLID